MPYHKNGLLDAKLREIVGEIRLIAFTIFSQIFMIIDSFQHFYVTF